MTVTAEILDPLLRADPAGPRITYYDDATGERIELSTVTLGLAAQRGEKPQLLVPGHTVFGAEVAAADSFCLVSCMVSPGFDYQDFELFSAEALTQLFPRHQELIERLNG